MEEGVGFIGRTWCMTRRHRQQCGEGQRKGQRGRGKGKSGDICNSVTNKKLKKEKSTHKWTHAVQTCLVQGSTALTADLQSRGAFPSSHA